MVHTLGTILSLDEMMIRFLGRCIETHRMKNKPIGEGYKWFVLTTQTGYVLFFTPDGRMAEKSQKQEFAKDKECGKIESMVLYLTDVIQKFRDKQAARLGTYQLATRNNQREIFNEKMSDTFIIAMDNYFTNPKVIHKLRERQIGVIGTARLKRNWPPKELKEVSVDESNFNDYYYTYDKYGSLVGRWVDNNMVLIVSTIHKPGKMIKRIRRKPRPTATNKNHVSKVWGNEGKKQICIPTSIDDYNHWMLGVDVADQRIAYYQPDLRCQRTWLPMFIQILGLIRNNSFVVTKTEDEEDQKIFTLDMIQALRKKAHLYKYYDPSARRVVGRKRRNKREAATEMSKRKKVLGHSHLTIDDFPHRFSTEIQHLPKIINNRGPCVVCSTKYKEEKKRCKIAKRPCNLKWQEAVSRIKTVCQGCSSKCHPCFLCDKHRDQFHRRP